MLTSAFGSSRGTKLSESGGFRPFAGNTIIAPLLDSSIFPDLVMLQERLLSDGRDAYLVPLPQKSFHMTLFEGLCDECRGKDVWSSYVPLDAPIDKATAILKDRSALLPALCGVVMRFDSLRINGAVSVGLMPTSCEHLERLRRYRMVASGVLGIPLPAVDTYINLITLPE